MADLDKKYRELFPETATPVKAPEVKVEQKAEGATDLDKQYLQLFEPSKTQKVEAPKEYEGPVISQYKGPEIVDRQKEPLWRKAAKFVLPKAGEEFFGLDEPMPEKTVQQKMMEQESARQSYYREQKFTEMLDQAKQADPKDFELPEGYKEPGAIGQVLEGIHSGFRSTLLPAIGYFTESMGRKIGSPAMIEWGMESGDAAMVDYIRRPELMRPEDLKPFLDGGWTDLRAYGRTIGEIIPFMGSVIALSTAGGLVGGPGGALAGGWASASAIEQGNAYKSYIDSGVAPDKAADASFIYGLIAGGIENMMGVRPAGIANKILNPTKLATNSFKSYVMKSLPKMALGTIKMAVGEGTEEVLQQLTEDMMGKWAGSEEGMSTLKELGEQFVAGTVGSLPFGAVSTFRMPSISKEGVAPITPVTPEQIIQKPEVTPEPKPEEVIRVREEEAKIVMAEEKATKALKEAVTGQSITIEKSYSGIKEGVDSGFRTVEEAYAQGYADMKGGEVLTFTNEVLNNPYVTDGHKAVLNYLRENYADEVTDIEKRYASRIALQAEETGKFAAGPDLTQPVDDFIREKLQSEGFDSLIYTRGYDAAEYQVFNKVSVKPAVAPAPEPKPAPVEEKVRFTKGQVTKFDREMQYIKDEVKEDPDRHPAAIVFSHGFTFTSDIYDLYTYARLKKDVEFLKIMRDADLLPKETPGGIPIEHRFPGEPITQKAKVKEAVKEEPKTIKQIAEETKILEPNVRRILGVGAKEGVFERVEKGVYVLTKDGQDVAIVYPGDAVEILPKLVKDGFKADMVFLDIPYETPAVKGGNRPMGYDFITPTQFKSVVNNIKEIVQSEDSAVFYMYSQAKSGLKAMAEYNDVMTDAGFIPLARGEYTKLTKAGKPFGFPTPLGWKPLDPEGIIMFNLSGKDIAKAPVNLDFELTRPKGWKTEKPASMLKDLIEMTTAEGETILDPFAGSGVAIAEAVRAKRKAVGIELEEEAIEKHIKPKVEEAAKEVKPTAKEEFKVGDVFEVKGNMVSPATIRKIEGNSLYFTDSEGTDYSGFARSTARTLIKEGEWKKVEKVLPKAPTPKEAREAFAKTKKPEAIITDVTPPGFGPEIEAIPEAKVKDILPKANLNATVKQATGKSTTLPILANFLVQKGKLMATDLEVGVRLNTDLKDGTYKIVGKEAVDAKEVPVEDFPIVPEVKGKLVGRVLMSNLSDALKRANLSISKSYQRPELGGVLLEIKNNIMNVASTDSFRLFQHTQLLKGENADVKLIIPATKVQKILASMKEDSVTEIYNEVPKKGEEYAGMVHFRTKFGDITVRKIEGEFPAYQEIYPEINKRYVLDRKQFLAALKELKPFVSATNDITITYKDGKLDLLAENKAEKISKKLTLNTTKDKVKKVNAGSANDGVLVMEIKDDRTPQQERFRFNVNYLIDAMNALTEDRVLMYAPDQVAESPKLFSTVAEENLKSVAKPKGTANATIGKFREGEDVELGNMDKVKPIEFPELVELTRDLMGRVPEISRRLRTALGKFYGTEKGRIKLRPDIFKDEAQASRVLAHEIGHLVDYLPHQILKRGNLLGSLLSLRHFLKNQFGEVDIKNNEIREELKVVTNYWRPYEESEVSESYRRYRNSARELYADAVSLLFNSPGTLERLAPKFYKGFFDGLDAKPEVKNAYFDIQEVLSHDRATLIALRRKRTKEMFDRAAYKAEELQEIEEKKRKLTLKNYWNRFTYAMRSINQPIYDKVKQAEAEGKYIPDDENPKYLLSGQNYLSGQIKAEFEENIQPVMEDLTKNEITWQTFGEFLLYERVAEGDRSEFANPGGINKSDATERIATIKKNFGDQKFKNLEKNANSFRNFLKRLSSEAFEAGMITPEMKKTMETNEKYSPFQVVEYMERKVSWRAMPQIGTLKDINNPANSLILKAISTIRAIETQKNRMATFKMLETNFADEIQEAKLQFTGKAQAPVDTREEGMGMITYYKEGKLRGKYVDQYIAKSLERDSIARSRAIMTVLSPVSYLNKKLFRPLFVIYNPGWIPFNFIRDFMRFWKNTPNLSFIRAGKRYGQAFRAAKVRAFGMSKKESAAEIKARDMIRKLEKEKVLSVTWNDMLAGQEIEDTQIQAIMENMGLAESKKEIPAMYKPAMAILEKTKILSLLKGIRKVGDLIETLPKVAGYIELEGKMQPNQMREFVRKNIGSPDFFEKGWATAATNNIFLFSNAFIQAVTADSYIATNPTTRSGFWWKTGKVIIVPKILMYAALMGAFGDKYKEWMSDASEYDMSNYFVIPIGRDTNSEKTIYLRIPMDETSRLIGALAWKIMRGSSNDQAFGRDVMDVANLFGGQLPGLSPAISAPLSAFNFATGQNPYDSFRGRMVLTDEQMQAGGWYALKPFLIWEFQQMGGSTFMKMYGGEQIPREKSAGEKFLQLPIISNIAGRFVRISDYGQLEKYRAKIYEIKGEKARERIDEDKLINEYVKKYQEGEGDTGELSQDLIMDVLGHAVSSKEEKLKATNIRKKFKISIERGKADPKINAMISAVSNEEKVTLMRVYKEIMSEKDFVELRTELLKYKIISTNVLRELNKPFQP